LEGSQSLDKCEARAFLGFVHSIQYGKPSLVCDFQELYRHLIDYLLIRHCQNLKSKDFTVKIEDLTRDKKGKRVYLNDIQTKDLTKELNGFFESYVEIPRIKVGRRQAVETLINEGALLFARFLRNGQETWIPRITS
jgi:CRISPR/Cas system-associated endonuclease Cas1